jgi:CO/xanthine dehydrogenase Mo-binding subunit
MPAPRFVGSEVKRLEDPRLLRGQAQLGYDALRAEQAAARRVGRHLGIGLSTFVETASTGPSRTGALAGHEYGAVRVEPSGRVLVLTGASPHGQGTASTCPCGRKRSGLSAGRVG